MANYRMTKEADGLYRITLGRNLIGHCRRWEGGAWEAKAKTGRGAGPTPQDAFRAMVRDLNNQEARRAGYACAADMVAEQNRQVEREVAETNAMWRSVMGEGFGNIARVRKGRRVLV